MYCYRIAEVTLQSVYRLASFGEFAYEPATPDILLEETDELPPSGDGLRSGMVVHLSLPDGWYFYSGADREKGLFVSRDYSRLRLRGLQGPVIAGRLEWYVRIAVECMLARRGYVSLHSAAVEVNGEAFAFSGPSGLGKSTRAQAWIEALDAKLINSDRPLIDVRGMRLYGVPWDGKEQCFRNVSYPLNAICEVRRSGSVYVRNMSFPQRRSLLLQQCFIPMWDSDTAVIQMANITRLAAKACIIRIFCGPDAADARALYEVIQKQQFLKEENDLKAKPGLMLRETAKGPVLMPAGKNGGSFRGIVLLNAVSAMVWNKLKYPVSREDLLNAVLDEFEVERTVAAADLDALLVRLKEYGVITEA